jgi:CRISPR-associated exonuclease Cas4
MTLADDPARLRILTDLDATLLVEAAAGTGKTALMAGRLTMLLARGTEPARSPRSLSQSLPRAGWRRACNAMSRSCLQDVRLNLAACSAQRTKRGPTTHFPGAAAKLDELTTATIHAFCQTIISSYAVEADIDPGARILDAVQAAAAFDSVFEQWLKRRLNAPERPGDAIAILSRDDPRRIVDIFRNSHASVSDIAAHALCPPSSAVGPDIDLADAVADFRRWISSQPVEPKT